MQEPPELVPERDALLLDFDGTLVEIAPTPDSVQVAPGLPDLLQDLMQRLGGAFAIVTGRPVEAVDRFLAPARLAVAGLHGRDRRLADGTRQKEPLDPALIAEARARLAALAERLPGTLIEDKGESVALHYRLAPESGPAVLAGARAVAEESGGALRLVPGKMVAELVPAGVDKGTAVELLMALTPFRSRRPVFVGDDFTDEHGFAAAQRLGGAGVRVGSVPDTQARYILPDVAAVHAWLTRAAG